MESVMRNRGRGGRRALAAHPKTHNARRLVAINFLSFAAQVVQIGTVPPTLALKLEGGHASSVLIGAVAAGPWVAIVLVSRWIPRLLTRWGFVNTLLIGLATSATALVGMTVTNDAVGLLCLNSLFGLGLIVRWVACDTWIVAASQAHYRGRAIGVHETLMGFGVAAGPLVLTLVHGSVPSSLFLCVFLLAASGAVTFALRSDEEQVPIPAAASGSGSLTVLSTAILGGGLAGLVETSAISFVPVSASQGHWASSAMMALLAFGVGGTVLQAPMGWAADRLGCRSAQRITALALLLSAILTPLMSRWLVPAYALLFCWGGTAGGMNTLAVIEAGNSPLETSRSMMCVAAAYTVGSIIGPLLTGAAVAQSPGWGLSLMTVAGVLGLLTSVRSRPISAIAS